MVRTPDRVIEKRGKEIELFRPYLDSDDNLKYESSVTVKGIVSKNTLSDTVREALGRIDVGDLNISVKTGVDVQSNRNGYSDVFKVNGQYYEVSEVVFMEHTFVGIEKKTVTVNKLDEVEDTYLIPEEL